MFGVLETFSIVTVTAAFSVAEGLGLNIANCVISFGVGLSMCEGLGVAIVFLLGSLRLRLKMSQPWVLKVEFHSKLRLNPS